MNYTPKTSEQIEEEARARREAFLLPAGEYDFEIGDAKETVSKKSKKEMWKLELQVFGNDGKPRAVTDYIVAGQDDKLYALAWCIGMGDEYDNGTFSTDDLQGRCGRAKIKVDKQDGYDDKNAVRQYVVPKPGQTKMNAVTEARKAASEDPDLDIEDQEKVPF